MRVRLPFKPRTVQSVKRGQLTFTETVDGVQFTVPLDAADIITLRK